MKRNFIFKLIQDKTGFSIVETLLASAVLSVVGVMAARGLGVAMKQMDQTEVRDSKINLSANILNTLVTNASSFQVDYSSTSPVEYLGNYDEFKRAWDTDGRDSTVEKCPTCRGRYDFIFKPVPNNKAMAELWVGIYHPETVGDQKLRIYRRVVGTR